VAVFLARAMQVTGLAWLPVGLYRGWAADDLRAEMTFLVAGACLFLLGRWVESRVAKR